MFDNVQPAVKPAAHFIYFYHFSSKFLELKSEIPIFAASYISTDANFLNLLNNELHL